MDNITLRQARELVGLTQLGLDKLAGVPLGTTHDLENRRNRNPAHHTVVRLVRALRGAGLAAVTSDQLFPVPDDNAVQR